MRKILSGILAFIFIVSSISAVRAEETVPPASIPLQTEAAILVEQSTGRILYERNMRRRMYPASMTKLLTALVVMDYLDPDDIIVVGPEVHDMPLGYATGVHVEGEHITVRMLLRSLLIRSANESARILSLNAVRVRNERPNMGYNEAKGIFATMLNAKAQELGTIDTRFTNPYGLHDSRHITTAYDMALIARAFMDVPLLAEIVGTYQFSGDGLEGAERPPGATVRDFTFTNTNQMLPEAVPHGHPYVNGIRTGFTTPAGECFAASAFHNGMGLITIVFDSESPGRWNDTRHLLDFGFDNFSFRTIDAAESIDPVLIYNPRLEDDGTLAVFSEGTHTALLSHSEYDAVTRVITYGPAFLVLAEEYEEMEYDGETRIRVPEGGITEGDIVGLVSYEIDGEVLFTANIYAAHDVEERTFDSDMDFFIARFFNAVFTRQALPYWFGSVGTLFGILGFSVAIIVSRRARRYYRWQSTPRGRY